MSRAAARNNRYAGLPVQRGEDSDSPSPAHTQQPADVMEDNGTHRDLEGVQVDSDTHAADETFDYEETFAPVEAQDAETDSRAEYSPTSPNAVLTGGEDVVMDDEFTQSRSPSPERIPSHLKGKSRAGTVRTADEAGLSPPWVKNKAPRRDDEYKEDDLPPWFEPYSPPPLPHELEANRVEVPVPETGGGFMADARKAPSAPNIAAQVANDEALAQAIHEQINGTDIEPLQGAVPPVDGAGETYTPAAPVIRAASAGPVKRTPTGRINANSGAHAAGQPGAAGPSAGTSQPAPGGARAPVSSKPAAAAKPGLVIPNDLDFTFRPWNGPVPIGPTFKSLTGSMDPEQREDWLKHPGEATLAYPAQPGSANADVFAQKVQMFCDGIFRGMKHVEVSAAYEHKGLRGPLAMILGTKAQIDFLNGQRVLNNSLQAFFCVAREQQPASMTHTVTGIRLPPSKEGEQRLLAPMKTAVEGNAALAEWLDEYGDAVPTHVAKPTKWIADGLRAKPVRLNLPGTNTPGVWWNVFSRNRPARSEEALEVFREVMEKIPFKESIAGKYQRIQKRFICSICLGCTHRYGLCDIATHPDWLGVRPRTKEAPKPENKGIVLSEMHYGPVDPPAPRGRAPNDKPNGRKK